MKRLVSFLSVSASAFLLCYPVISALAETLFFDDFSGAAVNPSNWSFPTGNGSFYGRTQIHAAYPPVSGGVLHLRLDTYNPTALTPGDSFYGSEIFTKKSFSRGSGGLRVVARARLVNPLPGGMVGGIFLYKFFPKTSLHNEIDDELLSNETNGKNRLLTNAFANESLGFGHPQFVKIPGLKLTAFNTYQIDWLQNCVVWYINGRLVRVERSIVPSGDLTLHLNFWAPACDWPDACNPRLIPASSAVDNKTYSFNIDWVRIVKIPSYSCP